MTEQDSNAASQPPTHRDRFEEACKATDFTTDPRTIGGYVVWGVRHLRDGEKTDIDGPFFTEEEAQISADLLREKFRSARAYQLIHCSAWNPDPGREKAIRDDAMASRMMLAMQVGADVSTHTTNGN